MNIQMKAGPPKFNIYVNYLGLFLIVAIAIAIPVAILSEDLSVSTIIILLLWPVAWAAGLTFSTRKYVLRIDQVAEMDELNQYIMEFLVSENMMTVSEDAGGVWMESTKPWNRWFNHWFGTEKLRIIRTPVYIQVIGHRRYIDGLDSKLRFGRKN